MYYRLMCRSVLIGLIIGMAAAGIRAGEGDTTAERDRSSAYKGIGLNVGITLFIPAQVNDMIGDIYNEFKRGYMTLTEIGEPFMFMGESFKAKGVFYLNRYFAIEPYALAFWAGKYIVVSGAADKSAWVHVLWYSGGANLWVRFSPAKLVSFKTGAGGFGGYSTIEVVGDAGRVSLKGLGYGGNILAGLDLTFGKIAVNVDFTVPVGVINYRQRVGSLSIVEDSYASSPSSYTAYPERILLIGFEFRPGVTFRF